MNKCNVPHRSSSCALTALVWIKKVEVAKYEAQRPPERSELKHAERMSEAEREKFQLIKAINDQELAVQQLDSAVAAAKAQLSKVKQQSAAIDQPNIDIYSYPFQRFPD